MAKKKKFPFMILLVFFLILLVILFIIFGPYVVGPSLLLILSTGIITPDSVSEIM